jgi:hypothetical protein
MMTNMQAERHNIEVGLQRLSEADETFKNTLITSFRLANKASSLFEIVFSD